MNILTFDIEEWFHILDNDSTRTVNEWKDYEQRIHQNLDRIFSFLDRRKQSATFFCLGWMAELHPHLIQEIVDRGYEIGSHSHMHQLIFEQGPNQFKKDLEQSVKLLEDISGQKVKYFRAPGFSIREDTKWAFEILVENGIEIDCSIFSAPRAHGGFPSYKAPMPSILKYNGIELKELPINFVKFFRKSIIFSGGGYFRLLPYHLIKHYTRKSDYIMTYFHPRDFDPDQPMIKDLRLTRKFKSYVGLKSAHSKLEKWLSDFSFTDIKTAARNIDWNTVPVVNL